MCAILPPPEASSSGKDLRLLDQAQRSTRSTVTLSISLTPEERAAVEERASG